MYSFVSVVLTRLPIFLIVLNVFLCGFCSPAKAFPQCVVDWDKELKITAITIKSHPIFDEDAADAIPLHGWANALHIVTEEWVIRERLSFSEGDVISQDDVVEAEAILRSQRFLGNAEIITEEDCEQGTVIVHVTTWDNWSLIPAISVSRSGGENKSLFGIREDNLLGLGIRATARYKRDEQRSGYELALNSIMPGVRHANIGLTLADNDDGERYSVVFDKPFYHLNTETSMFAHAYRLRQVDDIFQNNGTRNSFLNQSHGFSAAYGWRLSATDQESRRFTIGISRDSADFSLAAESLSRDLALVPESRDFLVPWVRLEYAQRNIVVMEDIYLINQPEDINLGWQLSSQVGLEAGTDEGGIAAHSQLSARKGFSYDKSLLMLDASFVSITNGDVRDLLRFDANAEYFQRSSKLLGYYARFNSTFSRGQFLDEPIAIDDDNGVRGFPNQYQHGDHRVSASAEIRMYTDYSIYQLVEVGFAGFVDVGRAWSGTSAELNRDPDMLASIGIGARFFSKQASNAGVLHMDFAKPFSSDGEVDNWEWSFNLRRSF